MAARAESVTAITGRTSKFELCLIEIKKKVNITEVVIIYLNDHPVNVSAAFSNDECIKVKVVYAFTNRHAKYFCQCFG